MFWPFGHRRKAVGQLDTAAMGRLGEKLAKKHLRQKGLKVLATNYRCPAGEADMIALAKGARGQPDTIIIVEVKTRASDAFIAPEAAVDGRKRKHLRRVASYYLAARDTRDLGLRFDIVSIVLAAGTEPKIKHIENAF